MDKGIYCLVFKNPACTVRIGALGPVAFREGWHIYVGSALGSGGLARLDRHIALARDRDKRPKWHVDYLLTDRPVLPPVYRLMPPPRSDSNAGLPRTLGEPGVPSVRVQRLPLPVPPAVPGTGSRRRRSTQHSGSLGLVPVTKTIMNRSKVQ